MGKLGIKLPWRYKLFYAAGIALVSSGLYLAIKPTEQPPTQTDSPTAAAPQLSEPETKKPKVEIYTVAPDMPRYLTITKLDVKARMLNIGSTNDQIDAPANVHDAGWYNKSAKPGKNGAMVVDGHVSSWTAKGVFYGLDRLVPGDEITVERGDGKIFNFTVAKTTQYEAKDVDMRAVLKPFNSAKQGLNLITCSGAYDRTTQEFEKRFVVFATLKN